MTSSRPLPTSTPTSRSSTCPPSSSVICRGAARWQHPMGKRRRRAPRPRCATRPIRPATRSSGSTSYPSSTPTRTTPGSTSPVKPADRQPGPVQSSFGGDRRLSGYGRPGLQRHGDLIARDFARGNFDGLASGQAIAQALGCPVIPAASINPTDDAVFNTGTPLIYTCWPRPRRPTRCWAVWERASWPRPSSRSCGTRRTRSCIAVFGPIPAWSSWPQRPPGSVSVISSSIPVWRPEAVNPTGPAQAAHQWAACESRCPGAKALRPCHGRAVRQLALRRRSSGDQDPRRARWPGREVRLVERHGQETVTEETSSRWSSWGRSLAAGRSLRPD